MRQIILLSLSGAVLGIAIWFMIFMAHDTNALSNGSYRIDFILLNGLFSALFGIISMGSSIVYDIEEWSILRSTVSHFAVVFISFNVIALSLGWFSFGSIEYWIIHIIMFIIYIMIWLIQYLIFRHKVKELNRKLKDWKSPQEK